MRKFKFIANAENTVQFGMVFGDVTITQCPFSRSDEAHGPACARLAAPSIEPKRSCAEASTTSCNPHPKSKGTAMNLFSLAAFVAGMSLFGSVHSQVVHEPVNRSHMAAEWPFTVEAGVLECHRKAAIAFRAGGQTYAVNGTATSLGQAQGWRPVKEIWRDDPTNPGAKVSIGPIVARGQQLCARS